MKGFVFDLIDCDGSCYGSDIYVNFLVIRFLFAVGGHDEYELLDSVERYDPQLNTWSLVAPLPQKMRCMASVSFKGKLFLFGGEMSSEITNSAYWYLWPCGYFLLILLWWWWWWQWWWVLCPIKGPTDFYATWGWDEWGDFPLLYSDN